MSYYFYNPFVNTSNFSQPTYFTYFPTPFQPSYSNCEYFNFGQMKNEDNSGLQSQSSQITNNQMKTKGLKQKSQKTNQQSYNVQKQNFARLKKKKPQSKQNQKQSRNIISNLLRIFFKNILQVRIYDKIINQIIRKYNYSISSNDFYTWLISFGINFKNYIRFHQIKKIFIGEKEYLHIFRTLAEHFMKVMAVNHCLTSKRICCSMKLHLEGLRNLWKQLFINSLLW